MKRFSAIALVAVCATAVAHGDELKRRGLFGAKWESGAAAVAGLRVKSTEENSLAAKLALQPNDQILSVNGNRIASLAGLERELRKLRSGDRIAVEIQRGSARVKVDGVLPEAPREEIAGADVIYDSVQDARGERLRTIITKPAGATEKLPVVFVAGWLSDDSVEAPADTKDAACLVFRGLAVMPNFATMRVDKPGVGDSEGDCAETDFETELSGYRAAFASLSRHDFIDADRVFILGVSNGGGFAPIVPKDDADVKRVRGYISVGGWSKTWFEHMLEIERRRLALSGKSPAEVNESMKKTSAFYNAYLMNGQTPGEVLARNPDLKSIWTGDEKHQYGRPAAFYHQLQRLNLEAAWSKVAVPTLAMHGEFDWIMSRDDIEKIAAYVNANAPDQARFMEVPQMGHTFQHFASMEAAFKGDEQPFDESVLRLVTDWLQEHRNG
jgi:pimeloyl-ACP methyl ester carboxylesterase